MNTRILGSIATIVAVVGGVSAVTFAIFSDAGTSSENIFTTGNLNMQLSDTDETDEENVLGTFGLANAGPGDTFSGDLRIKNEGSVDATNIQLQLNNTVTEAFGAPGNNAGTPMDRVIRITALDWDSNGDNVTDTNLLSSISDWNGNGIIDLSDMANQNVAGSIDITGIAFNSPQLNNHRLHIAGEYSLALMTNEHQGDSVNSTLTVTMNQ